MSRGPNEQQGSVAVVAACGAGPRTEAGEAATTTEAWRGSADSARGRRLARSRRGREARHAQMARVGMTMRNAMRQPDETYGRRRQGAGRRARLSVSRLARWRLPAWSVLLALCVSLIAPPGAAAQTAPRPSDSDIEYYHTDAIGSVRMITNDAGIVIAQHDYLPFGTAFGQPQPSVNQPRGFAGKEFDPETGFDYFGGRYLIAGAARFTTVDPVLRVDVASANPQRWYRYSYALNGPLRHSDPDGREVPVVVNGRFYNSGIDGTRVASGSDANWTFAKFVGIVLGGAAISPILNAGLGCVVTPSCNAAVVTAIAASAPGSGLPIVPGVGNAGNAIGATREAAVAALTGGQVSRMKVTTAFGSTDIDVLSATGAYIGVGGPGKGLDLAKFGRQLQRLRTAADQAGVEALFYFEKGTPQSVIDFTKKRLGEGNVFTFEP